MLPKRGSHPRGGEGCPRERRRPSCRVRRKLQPNLAVDHGARALFVRTAIISTRIHAHTHMMYIPEATLSFAM